MNHRTLVPLLLALALLPACQSSSSSGGDNELSPSRVGDGAPSQSEEPERERETSTDRVESPCSGYGTASVKGPEESGEGYGFLTLEHTVVGPCVRELIFNGELVERELEPCEKYRLRVGTYDLDIEVADPEKKRPSNKQHYRLQIEKDKTVRFPYSWVDCISAECAAGPDCLRLDEVKLLSE